MKLSLQELKDTNSKFEKHLKKNSKDHFYILNINQPGFYNIKDIEERKKLIVVAQKELFKSYHPDRYSGDSAEVIAEAKVCESYITNAVNVLSQSDILEKDPLQNSSQYFTQQPKKETSKKQKAAFKKLLDDSEYFKALQHPCFEELPSPTKINLLNQAKKSLDTKQATHGQKGLINTSEGQDFYSQACQYLTAEYNIAKRTAYATAHAAYVANKPKHYNDFLVKAYAKFSDNHINRHTLKHNELEKQIKAKHEPGIQRWTAIAEFCKNYLSFIKPLNNWVNKRVKSLSDKQLDEITNLSPPSKPPLFEEWKMSKNPDSTIYQWAQGKGYASVDEFIAYQGELNRITDSNNIEKQCLQTEYFEHVTPVVKRYTKLEAKNQALFRNPDVRIRLFTWTAPVKLPSAPESSDDVASMTLAITR
jgi:hypothetical protein